jgi:hypothetical protein
MPPVQPFGKALAFRCRAALSIMQWTSRRAARWRSPATPTPD